METVGIFYVHLEYCTVIWYILWPLGNVVVIWYIFPCLGILCQEKSGNPDAKPSLLARKMQQSCVCFKIHFL
jgi:hypothetical protein